MNSLLSFKMWGIFLHRLINACFPAEVVFLIFSKETFKRVKDSRALRVLLIFIFSDLLIRMVVFFAGIPFSGRYLLPWTIGVLIVCGAGLTPLVSFVSSKIPERINKISQFHIYAFIVFGIMTGYSIKALHPRNDKPWLQAIPAKIRSIATAGVKPVIITNYMDERFGYYAGTTSLYELKISENWNLLKKVKKGNDARWQSFDHKRGIENLNNKIERLGKQRVFIIVRLKKHGKSKTDMAILEKLPGIKLVKTFTDRKKRKLNLYSFRENRNTP